MPECSSRMKACRPIERSMTRECRHPVPVKCTCRNTVRVLTRPVWNLLNSVPCVFPPAMNIGACRRLRLLHKDPPPGDDTIVRRLSHNVDPVGGHQVLARHPNDIGAGSQRARVDGERLLVMYPGSILGIEHPLRGGVFYLHNNSAWWVCAI